MPATTTLHDMMDNPMIEQFANPDSLSRKRLDLCSRTHAQRIAGRLLHALGKPMAVIPTGNPLQPFRVSEAGEGADSAIIEVRT